MSDDSETSQGEEYFVERILNKRTRFGKIEYLIKWKGYSEQASSWEPESNCDCPAIIEEFEESLKKKKKVSKLKDKPKPSPKKVRMLDSSDDDEPSIISHKNQNDTTKAKKSSQISVNSSSLRDQTNQNRPRGRPKSAASTRIQSSKIVIDSSDDDSQSEKVENEVPVEMNDDTNQISEDISNEVVVDSGLEPEGIIGATEQNGDLMFLVKWKNQNKADLISSRIVKLACPQAVLKFFEEKLTWRP